MLSDAELVLVQLVVSYMRVLCKYKRCKVVKQAVGVVESGHSLRAKPLPQLPPPPATPHAALLSATQALTLPSDYQHCIHLHELRHMRTNKNTSRLLNPTGHLSTRLHAPPTTTHPSHANPSPRLHRRPPTPRRLPQLLSHPSIYPPLQLQVRLQIVWRQRRARQGVPQVRQQVPPDHGAVKRLPAGRGDGVAHERREDGVAELVRGVCQGVLALLGAR